MDDEQLERSARSFARANARWSKPGKGSPEQWAKVLDRYADLHWPKYVERARAFLAGLEEQPDE